MGEIFGPGISAGVTVISAILIVVVLVIAFSIRKKIQPKDNDNEFIFWGKKQGGIENDPGEADEVYEDDEDDEKDE